MRFLPTALLSALALILLSPGAQAQIRASEPASFSQTIDGTTVRVDYHRPRTRGRSPLFGHGAVVWERIWTPGANWATKLSFQKPIEIDGVGVEPGTYSLWFEMDEKDFLPHEFFLEPDTLIYHTMGPPRADDQIRFPVSMETDAPFREVLTWDFEDIRSDGGTLALRWGTHRIAFDIKVEPSMRMATTEEEAGLALGEFQGNFIDPQSGEAGPAFGVRISHDDEGILHADWHDVEPMPQETHEFFNDLDMWLLPGGAEGWFIPGESYEPGVLRETWAGYFMEFEVVDGEGRSFLMRDDLDQIIMRGMRVK